MLTDTLVDAESEIGLRHAPIGVVGRCERRAQLEPARAHHHPNPVKARVGTAALGPGDRRLRGSDPSGELGL
jgi:hypothetical protein